MNRKNLYKKSSNWLFNNLEYFDPRKGSIIADDKYTVKAFTELLFIQNMFFPKNLFSEHKQRKIDNFVLNIIDKTSFYNYVNQNPDMMSVLPTIIEYLHNHGQKFDGTERITELIEYNYDLLAQKTAFRQLDLAYSFRKANIKTKFDSLQSIYRLTILNKKGNNFYFSDMDVYSVTHTIFYMTDMGRKEAPEIATNDTLALLLRLIELYILDDNMDILAELLICLKFLHYDLSVLAVSSIVNRALKILKKHQRRDGVVLGPGINLSLRDSKEKIFRLNYHTTMVTLGALYLYEQI